MAYDPNDAEDKKIVKKLVEEALAAQVEEHEADVSGLKTKNKELLGKLREAQQGKGDPAEIAALQDQLTESKESLAKAQKDLTKANTKLEETTGKLADEVKFGQDILVDGQLTEHLASNKIASEFMPAVKALLKPQVKVVVDDKGRNVVVGDKPIGDYIKEWSQGDAGKAFVSAAGNTGTGANGGSRVPIGGNGKVMTRAAYEELNVSNPAAASKHFAEGGTITDG